MQANKFGRSGVGDRVRDGGRGTNGGPSPQKTEGHARKRRRVTDGRDGGRGGLERGWWGLCYNR